MCFTSRVFASFLRNSSTSVCPSPFPSLVLFLEVWNKDLCICYLRKTGSAQLTDKTKRSAWHQMSHVASPEFPYFLSVGAGKDLCNVNMTGWYKGKKILRYCIVCSIVLLSQLICALLFLLWSVCSGAVPCLWNRWWLIETELCAVILQRQYMSVP